MQSISAVTYAASAFAFVVLTLILAVGWRGRVLGGFLLMATVVSALWSAYVAFAQWTGLPLSDPPSRFLEVIRNLVWGLFLARILSFGASTNSSDEARIHVAVRVMPWLSAGVFLLLLIEKAWGVWFVSGGWLNQWILPAFLLMAVSGLVSVEQVYRNSRPDRRWGLKYLCLGLFLMWSLDVFLYADAVLFETVDEDFWAARGLVMILMVPLVAVSAARNPQWSLDVFLSRRMVFYSATIVGVGAYLILSAIAGYYLRFYGGTWSVVLQTTLVAAAIVGLVILLSSGLLRSKVKVFFSKHFFNYKYDYREEWLRFIATVSGQGEMDNLPRRAVKALAQIVESPGGVLWLRQDNGTYVQVEDWNMASLPEAAPMDEQEAFVQFLAQRGWVVDLEEYQSQQDSYGELNLPEWVQESGFRMVVPLLQEENLLGFVILERPRARLDINFEDTDLLKTAGRQLAGHLAQMKADQELTESRQFEALTRLSTYVVHDLKNTLAQLDLMVRNADRHKHNPAFVDDMVITVDNAAGRMRRMLEQLRSGHTHRSVASLNLNKLLIDVVANKSAATPYPVLDVPEESVTVQANHDRLAAVIGNLIQNAQEATDGNGWVKVHMRLENERVIVVVSDNGCGMDSRFIQEKLFKPFYTTKGNSGMGIGAYEAREFARALGGDLQVSSRAGVGTEITMSLPRPENHK